MKTSFFLSLTALLVASASVAAEKAPGLLCWNGKAYPETVAIGVNAQEQMAYVNAAVLGDDGNNDTPWYQIQQAKIERADSDADTLLLVDTDGNGKYFSLNVRLNSDGPARGEASCEKKKCMSATLKALNQIKVGKVSSDMAAGIQLTCQFKK